MVVFLPDDDSFPATGTIDDQKYDIAAAAIAGIKEHVFYDTWRGTFRHESFTEKFIEVASRSHLIVDVGAEFGFYAWLALKNMPQNGVLYLFEPEPERYLALVNSMKEYPNVHVLQYAITDKRMAITLYKETVNHSGTIDSFVSQNSNGVAYEQFDVEAISLDEFFTGKTDRIDLIKMDIEGAELFALQGMKLILQARRTDIFMEYHRAYVESLKQDGTKIIEAILQKNGYSIMSCEGLRCNSAGLESIRVYLQP